MYNQLRNKKVESVQVKVTYQLKDMTDGIVTDKLIQFGARIQKGILDIPLQDIQSMVHAEDPGLFENGYEIVGMSSVIVQ
tara:strand:- start:3872 stop:4111 length:240 start_codon:yes stop_codon:yes gene_type:complete